MEYLSPSEGAHDNVRAGLRHLHLMAAVVRRPVEDVGVNREYVGKRNCFVSSRPLYMPVAHLETQISRIHILDI